MRMQWRPLSCGEDVYKHAVGLSCSDPVYMIGSCVKLNVSVRSNMCSAWWLGVYRQQKC